MGGENLILISMLSFLASRFRFTLVADATLLRFVLFQWFLVSCFTCAGFDFHVFCLRFTILPIRTSKVPNLNPKLTVVVVVEVVGRCGGGATERWWCAVEVVQQNDGARWCAERWWWSLQVVVVVVVDGHLAAAFNLNLGCRSSSLICLVLSAWPERLFGSRCTRI